MGILERGNTFSFVVNFLLQIKTMLLTFELWKGTYRLTVVYCLRGGGLASKNQGCCIVFYVRCEEHMRLGRERMIGWVIESQRLREMNFLHGRVHIKCMDLNILCFTITTHPEFYELKGEFCNFTWVGRYFEMVTFWILFGVPSGAHFPFWSPGQLSLLLSPFLWVTLSSLFTLSFPHFSLFFPFHTPETSLFESFPSSSLSSLTCTTTLTTWTEELQKPNDRPWNSTVTVSLFIFFPD